MNDQRVPGIFSIADADKQRYGNSGIGNSLSVGASIGYAARVGQGFRIMPEVAVLVPLVSSVSVNGNGDAAAGFAGGLIQFKVGLLFGRGRKAPEATEPAAEE